MLNSYNTRAPKYIKQTFIYLKGETDCNIIILGNLNTSLSVMDRSSRQKIDKETFGVKLHNRSRRSN